MLSCCHSCQNASKCYFFSCYHSSDHTHLSSSLSLFFSASLPPPPPVTISALLPPPLPVWWYDPCQSSHDWLHSMHVTPVANARSAHRYYVPKAESKKKKKTARGWT